MIYLYVSYIGVAVTCFCVMVWSSKGTVKDVLDSFTLAIVLATGSALWPVYVPLAIAAHIMQKKEPTK